MRLLRYAVMILAAAAICLAAPSLAAAMTSSNDTPFPSSTAITAAHWASARHAPPRNQFGDILPIAWGDDNNLYVLMDDGGTDSPKPGALWRNSFARITGSPLHNLRFQRIGNSPPPATWAQIHRNRNLWSGPLGNYYATGFTSVDHVFFATQVDNWNWGANGPFTGLAGIAYSTNHGTSWQLPVAPVPGADRQPQLGAARARRHRAGRLRLRDLDRARVQRQHADARPQPARHRRHDEPRREWQWASGWAPTPTPWPSVVELDLCRKADPHLARPHHVPADVLRPRPAHLSADVHLLVRHDPARDLEERLGAGDPRSLASVGSVLVRGPSAVLRALERIRPRDSGQMDQRPRAPAVADLGRELRRLRARSELRGRVRLQLPAHSADDPRPRGERRAGPQATPGRERAGATGPLAVAARDARAGSAPAAALLARS